ncbi:MAG: hypothetical protein AAF333_06030 [Planctomycetota bacterium]
MNRSARRRHALLWVILGPAILAALFFSIKARPPAAVSDGPVPVGDSASTPYPSGIGGRP